MKTQASADETIVVYQVGDFLDLWREASGSDDQIDVAARIKDDHQELILALLDDKLKTRFLLGNHDFDLYRWPDYTAWERRYYLPDTSLQSSSVLLVHGDIFDWVESLPPKLNQIFVYIFAPHLSPNDYALGPMREAIRQSHAGRDYRKYIQNPRPATIGEIQKGQPDNIPAR